MADPTSSTWDGRVTVVNGRGEATLDLGGGGSVAVRAVRGATQVEADDREQVLAASRELVTLVLEKNGLTADNVISIFFTATKDLASVAPALAARQLGLDEVALICVQEMWVEGSMPRVVRLLAHVETDRPRSDITNVYLNGTEMLRRDVPPVPDGESA
jgi:chorismate mutase